MTALRTTTPPRDMKLLRELQTMYMTLSMTFGTEATSGVRPVRLSRLLTPIQTTLKVRRRSMFTAKTTSMTGTVTPVTPPTWVNLLAFLLGIGTLPVPLPIVALATAAFPHRPEPGGMFHV